MPERSRDLLGSTKILDDTYDYDFHGNVAAISDALSGNPGNRDMTTDAATKLSYMQQRYYDPVVGRFISADPVATDPNTGAMFNRYNYANNNPYRFTDPDGRLAFDDRGSCQKANACLGDDVKRAAGRIVKRAAASVASRRIGRAERAVTTAKDEAIADAKAFVGARDKTVSAGFTGMAAAPVVGNKIGTPSVGVVGNASLIINFSKGQLGIQFSWGATAGTGGGATIGPDGSLGLNGGALENGFSNSNFAYAQLSSVVVNGTPIASAGGSVSYSGESGSASLSGRGGVGSYIGTGVGSMETLTITTPPLWGAGD